MPMLAIYVLICSEAVKSLGRRPAGTEPETGPLRITPTFRQD